MPRSKKGLAIFIARDCNNHKFNPMNRWAPFYFMGKYKYRSCNFTMVDIAGYISHSISKDFQFWRIITVLSPFYPHWSIWGLAAHGWSGGLLSAVPLGDVLGDVLQLVVGAPPSSLMDRNPCPGRSIWKLLLRPSLDTWNMGQYGFVWKSGTRLSQGWSSFSWLTQPSWG